MKKLMIVLLLALPAVAYAYPDGPPYVPGTTNMHLYTPGATYVPGPCPHGPISTVEGWWDIEVDSADVAVEIPLEVYVDLAMPATVSVMAGLGSNGFDQVIQIGNMVTWAPPFAAWTFQVGNPAGSFLAQNEDIGRVNINEPVAAAGPNQLFVTTTLKLPPLPYCTWICIFPRDSWEAPLGPDKGAWAAMGGDNAPFDNLYGLCIHITPEPATMLLLAGALPFLRRRTA